MIGPPFLPQAVNFGMGPRRGSQKYTCWAVCKYQSYDSIGYGKKKRGHIRHRFTCISFPDSFLFPDPSMTTEGWMLEGLWLRGQLVLCLKIKETAQTHDIKTALNKPPGTSSRAGHGCARGVPQEAGPF